MSQGSVTEMGLAGERYSGRCWSLLIMRRWSHGTCDSWQKHAPLHHDVAQSDVCGHPTQYRIKNSSSSPLSAHPSCDRNFSRSHWADMSAKLTLSIISGWPQPQRRQN